MKTRLLLAVLLVLGLAVSGHYNHKTPPRVRVGDQVMCCNGDPDTIGPFPDDPDDPDPLSDSLSSDLLPASAR